MFGFVLPNGEELTPSQKERYGAVYCGICRQLRTQGGQLSRLALSYDMAFLATLLMSLYEPEEASGPNACILHPIKKRPWVANELTAYAADMNVALGYYKAMDDWQDDHRLSARAASSVLGSHLAEITARYPRQCRAIEECIRHLTALERSGCPSPDETANCFGQLMAELLVWREDLWAPTLRQMGHALGRFIYLADAAIDYRSDRRKGSYNPFIAMGTGEDWPRWESYLILDMARCTEYFEKLPLVQDKDILDNVLYSGIWTTFRRRQKAQTAREESE